MSSLLDIGIITLTGVFSVSVLAIILSSWSLDTFRKLRDKSTADDNFETKCKVNVDSVRSGLNFTVVTLVVSLIVFIYCCLAIARKAGYIK